MAAQCITQRIINEPRKEVLALMGQLEGLSQALVSPDTSSATHLLNESRDKWPLRSKKVTNVLTHQSKSPVSSKDKLSTVKRKELNQEDSQEHVFAAERYS
ncbi:hypothetical protein TNCV_564641 [Trichonephila clavipes]|nr:hypothetical protein TNCV_564641 [Trichonephila clavipes]